MMPKSLMMLISALEDGDKELEADAIPALRPDCRGCA